ncbi:MAG: hypothetical protein NUW37_17885 [Planctomycetes bacterium]|nr:hypothetical protein [Planctomycetota bacterium]MCR4318218.1 hypothetical protein [Planctomycetota bacterium]
MREWRQDWRDIFHTFRIAIDPRKLLLTFAGVAFTITVLIVWWWVWGNLEATRSVLQDADGTMADEEGVANVVRDGDDIWSPLSWVLEKGLFYEPDGGEPAPVVKQFSLSRSSLGLVKQFFNDFVFSPPTLFYTFLLIVFKVVAWVVWALLAGAISRITAIEIARDERIDIKEALQYSWNKLSSLFWSPLFPLVAVGVLAACIFLWGLVGAIPWIGPLVTAITSPLAIFTAVLMAFGIIGFIVGWPLMGPAICAEGTDLFDGVSKAYSYVYSKPWHLIFYRYVLGAFYCVITTIFVWVFALVFLWCMFAPATAAWSWASDDPQIYKFYRFMNIDKNLVQADRCIDSTLDNCVVAGVNPFAPQIGDEKFELKNVIEVSAPFKEAGVDENAPRPVLFGDEEKDLDFWMSLFTLGVGTLLVFALGVALIFPINFLITLETIIYFLMRRKVDGVRMSEVYLEEDEEQFDAFEALGLKPVTVPPFGSGAGAGIATTFDLAEPSKAAAAPSEAPPTEADEPEAAETTPSGRKKAAPSKRSGRKAAPKKTSARKSTAKKKAPSKRSTRKDLDSERD